MQCVPLFFFLLLLLLVSLYSCRLCRLVQGLVLMALVLSFWWCDVAFVLSVKMQFLVVICVCVCVCVLGCAVLCMCVSVCVMQAQFACRMFNISDEIIKWSWIDSRISSNTCNCFLQRLEREYNAKCELGKPKVAFRESMVQRCEWVAHSMHLSCWADVKLGTCAVSK